MTNWNSEPPGGPAPREVIGGNRPPPEETIRRVTDRLASDYLQLSVRASELIESAEVMPEEVRDEAMLEAFSNVIVAIRGAVGHAEAARVAEKEDYLRGGQAVDGFFGGIKERLAKAMNSLHRRVNTYNERKLAAERERRRIEAEEAARKQREEQERRDRLNREAEEAIERARRARLPETREQRSAEAKVAVAEAGQANAAAWHAEQQAEAARIETLRKSSEIARSRFDEGRLVTTRQVGYVELADRDAVDMNALRPYFTDAEIVKALRGWAKATGYAKSMPGVVVGKRDEAVVR